MSRLLAPAFWLMQRLRFAHKFLLLCLLIAVPLGLLTELWLAELGRRLDDARQELRGVEYLTALRAVLEPLAEADARAATAGHRDDGGAVTARLRAAAAQVDAVDARVGEQLGTTDLWSVLRPRVVHDGVSPGMLITESTQVTGKIGSIDADKGTITLTVEGQPRTYKAGPDVDLSKVKTGDEVTARATKALAIVVEKPESP